MVGEGRAICYGDIARHQTWSFRCKVKGKVSMEIGGAIFYVFFYFSRRGSTSVERTFVGVVWCDQFLCERARYTVEKF